MPIRVAIDGLGGVSRQLLAAITAGGFADLFEVVHINEPAGAGAAQRRLQFDSIYGRFPVGAEVSGDVAMLGEQKLAFTATADVSGFDWETLGVDVVVLGESGQGTPERAQAHIEQHAKKVIVAGSPGEGAKQIVFGVNEHTYDPDAHVIIGTGTARLNAVAILASLIQKQFAIARGSFNVVHPVSISQPVGDASRTELLEERSVFNLVPDLADRTSIELGELDPILGSKLAGSVLHAPVSPVAWTAFAVETERRFEREDAVLAITEAASADQYAGLLGVSTSPLVSSDMKGDARSVVVSIDELEMIGRAFVSVRGWFDADWALACRTADLIAFACEAGIPGTA